MGIYTDHWERYKQQSVRGTLRALLLFGIGLPCIAGLGYLLEPISNVGMAILATVIVLWLIAFTVVLLNASRVICPRCNAKYSRGRYLASCPKCGLRMLQEEP